MENDENLEEIIDDKAQNLDLTTKITNKEKGVQEYESSTENEIITTTLNDLNTQINTGKNFQNKTRMDVNNTILTENNTSKSKLNKNNKTSKINVDNPKISQQFNGNLLGNIEFDEHDFNNSKSVTQNLPDYEPFFPELSESLDEPILLLKTTVIPSVEFVTKTTVQTRLRTYTFVVTRVNGDEQIVTSTTEVKPQTKTLTLTEPVTKFTTLTLLDFDATKTLPFVPLTTSILNQKHPDENRGRMLEEARYNLATRVMSNGVEVIVAGDKTTLPGEPDVKRLLPSTIYKPITLKPSTLSNHMMMIAPKDASNIQELSSSIYTNEFVTKTCLTTFTYLTTFLENGTTTVSSHEQVVSNIATEERNTNKIMPTPSMGITLTQHPNLAVGVFLTTYTYLNTIMDGEQPLVVTSKHTVSNTVTAPDDYLSLLQPLEKASAIKDTNTYYSTISLEKTVYEEDKSQIVSTNEVVTQVVITESIPPKATSVMTSYIALDIEDPEPNQLSEIITSDVVKTYYVTYTYFNTLENNGQTTVQTNISIASDVVTEKLYLHPKRKLNGTKSVINTSPISKESLVGNKKKTKVDSTSENFKIIATKTYMTTYTYFTTLLQQNEGETSTVVSSHSRLVENVVTETLEPSLLDKKYIKQFRKQIKDGSNSIVKLATLSDGNKLEITAIAKEIKPTKVLPIEKTKMPHETSSKITIESSKPNVVTGSTILFDVEDPFAQLNTPSLIETSKSKIISTTQSKNELNSLLSSEIVRKPSKNKNTKRTASKSNINTSKTVINNGKITLKPSKIENESKTTLNDNKTKVKVNKTASKVNIKASPTTKPSGTKSSLTKPATSNQKGSKPSTAPVPNKNSNKNSNKLQNNKNATLAEPIKKKQANKVINKQPTTPVSDLLGLGSINMQALKPVLNAMAGLIQTNLKASRRNDSEIIKTRKPEKNEVIPVVDVQNRSPIYIPVGDIDTAESQNVNYHYSDQLPWNDNAFKDQIVVGKPTHESPLLNGGIPISPGEVITANSDVIIGKPGRIGPRIPSIPLNPDLAKDDTPIGMKPPPVVRNDVKTVKKDDYVGPVPPRIPVRPSNLVRGEKHKFNEQRPNNNRNNNKINLIPVAYDHTEVTGTTYNGINKFNGQEQSNFDKTNVFTSVYHDNNFDQSSSSTNFGANANYPIGTNFDQVNVDGNNNYQNSNGFKQNTNGFSQNTNGFSQNTNGFNQGATSFNQGSVNVNHGTSNFEQNGNFGHGTSSFEQNTANFALGTSNYDQSNLNIDQNKNYQNANNFHQGSTNVNHGIINYEHGAPNYDHGTNNFEQNVNFNQHNVNFDNVNGNNFGNIPVSTNQNTFDNAHIKINFQAHDNIIQKDNIASGNIKVETYQNHNEDPLILGTKVHHEFNLKSSILNQPLVLPEVIERSTGQPLLVNIQPSQVAFVNIPHNRTTALIYGGSTEIHHNGQYFDDPSPYPEPEFSGIESFNKGIPQFASVYNGGTNPNQKEVVGVIKVGTHVINAQPEHANNRKEIKPSRTNYNGVHLGANIDNRDVSLKVPPISFEMIQNGNDFNAHVINHGQVLSPPPVKISFDTTVQESNPIPVQNYKNQNNQNDILVTPPNYNNNQNNYNTQIINGHSTLQNPFVPPPKQESSQDNVLPIKNIEILNQHLLNSGETINTNFKEPNQGTFINQNPTVYNQEAVLPPGVPIDEKPPPIPNYKKPINKHIPYKPAVAPPVEENMQKLRPPNKEVPVRRPGLHPYRNKFPGKRPRPVQNKPDVFMTPPPVQNVNNVDIYTPQVPHQVNFENDGSTSTKQPVIRIPIQHVYENNEEVVDNKEPSLENDNDGIIQETNSRPLRPGQLPVEIQKQSSTTPKTVEDHNIVNFNIQVSSNNGLGHPRPFLVRPENQQTNEINNQDHQIKLPVSIGTSLQFGHVDDYPMHTSTHSNYLQPVSTTENNIFNGHNYFSTTPVITVVKPIDTKHVNTVTIKKPINVEVSTIRPLRDNIYRQSNIKPVVNYGHKIGHVVKITKKPTILDLNRPKITSLPIDVQRQTTSQKPLEPHFNLQTEEPFNDVYTKSSIGTTKFFINYHDSVSSTTERQQTTTKKQESSTYQNLVLNIGEIPPKPTGTTLLKPTTFGYDNLTKIIEDMEVMKPPPVTEKIKPPNVNMEPPKIDVNSPSGGIYHVPNISEKPFISKPSQDMLPPPPVLNDEEVMGMKPPPPQGTHKPILNLNQNVSTHKPVFSLEIDVPTTQNHQITTPKTYRVRTTIRRRRPVNRPSIIKIIGGVNNDTNGGKVKENNGIRPTPMVLAAPSMEVIIGHPQDKDKIKIKLQSSIELQGVKSSSIIPTPALDGSFTTGVHHGGNEIKVIDDGQPNKILPTRYITHTKTSTVTITKTTVVKSLGSPPSTMTILVTKTEKETVVDVVTEFHTLIKPTSIIETITTTLKPSHIYPSDKKYGADYETIRSTPVVEGETTHPTKLLDLETEEDEDDSLEEFIINETDPPISKNPKVSSSYEDNDSILIVMTDKNGGNVVKIPPPSKNFDDLSSETQDRDEVLNTNEVNKILLGGILIASPPSLDTKDVRIPINPNSEKCAPECKASKNELCQKVEGVMRCVCRPGFARMFPDRPCKPTYTYTLKLGLERYSKDILQFDDALADSSSPQFTKLAVITHDGLDRMVMQSDLRDIYHGIQVKGYQPSNSGFGIVSEFYLQLSDNADERRLEDVFKKYLRSNNYSLGGTDLYASRETLEHLQASDFDECTNQLYHDCSEHSQCFNLKGTYTCSCKEGYADLSENTLYPGRVCSAELVGCEKCHYHGTCYSRGNDQILCECFHWYAGDNCHINLKVLLIALVTLGIILFTLLLVCIILTCCRKRPQAASVANGMSFLPQRIAGSHSRRSTLDRRAMIQDTSSESGQSDTNTLPYIAKKTKKPKGALKKPTTQHQDLETGTNTLSFPDQKDRSLTVMIPRAKYHPAPPTSPHLNLASFEKRKMSQASSNETKLLSYLDAGPCPSNSTKLIDKRKYSLTNSETYLNEKQGSRKTSGALVSAGFEVSATVVPNSMGTLGTILTACGTEADRSENATLIQKISADLRSSTGTQSQFNTFKQSIANGVVEEAMNNWLDIPARVATISESRSYDETTIHAATKPYRNDYDSKPSSQYPNDEANTMAERDLGSTFLLPHTHLYKPDRGSDISGFESL